MPAAGKVVHSTSLQSRATHHLSLLCAELGCDAIEARAMWSAGDSTIVVQVEAGAAEGDVMKLKRIPRPEPVR
jgi:hypothetical protein